MIIREARKEESTIIADIWLMSMRNAHYGFKETYWTKQYKSIKIKYSQARSDIYVYEDGGVILGFGAFVRDYKGVRIFIMPGYQRKGIGTTLLNFFEQNYDDFYCRCYKQNKAGIYFLVNRGYDITEKRKNVDSAEEEYVFKKEKKQTAPASL